MAEQIEILALAVVEAFEDKSEQCLALLREFYAALRAKGYSRDLLYRDARNPQRFVNLRYWRSEEARDEAHEDPDVHRFWVRLAELSQVTTVFERLEPVSGEFAGQKTATSAQSPNDPITQ